jgi:DNA-binding CsgD family transcriptional regulator
MGITMDYMTVVGTAARWGVSPRLVHRYLQDGRVAGAVRFGSAWMIPDDAEKPVDLRRERETPQNFLSAGLSHVLSAGRISMSRDTPYRLINAVSEERLRRMHESVLAYARGDFARPIECYKQNDGDAAARLVASSLAIAAAISTGDYPFFTELETYVKEIINTSNEPAVKAYAELSLAGATLSAHAPGLAPDWIKNGDFSAIPPEAMREAVFKRVKYFHCINDHKSMLSAAQTALAYCVSPRSFTIHELYMRVMCAIACRALDRTDEAKKRLLDAMHIGLPSGFITPFAEAVLACGGLVEQCLKQQFPTHYDAVLEQAKRTIPNWIAFHNQFTKDNITLILSFREYQMASLIAQRIPYANVAKQFNISVGRLKNIMREIYGKLFISGRKELSQYII